MVFKKKSPEDKKSSESASKSDEASTSPVHKAFYIEKVKGAWLLVVADIQDDKVISKQTKEGMNKQHSLEEFKIAFAKHYYFGK